MAIISEVVHTFVCIQNTYANEVLSDSHKYVAFVSHICYFTFMTPYVFFVWQSYVFLTNASGMFTAIYK